MNFYIVDVFAESKYAGNQLAVFCGAGVAELSEAEMLLIAKEINYSETTFIPSNQPENGGYDVRIFTPKKELPFAGHPTLGTAFVLQQQIIGQKVDRVILNLAVGQIPVTFNYRNESADILWMRQNPPTFGQVLPTETLASVLNLQPDEIETNFPIQEVSTGVPFIIVPLKTLAAVKKAQVNLDKYFELINTTEAKEILIFCPETYSDINDLNVRVFAHSLGIPEDPATGSANGCLAGYLVEYTYCGESKIDVRVEQGYEIGRPSLLLLKAQKNQEEIEVLVGGKVVMVAKGEFV
ncbi:MAG: PhzF family phenazine biosynthesis protein [Microcoleus sp. PH2017_29_MFU_D_A]|uniref:PhzF family phenazine biosynthesis protein n=1 Tax=unclassified Microcoleus TaxID=2642155 RepID=UPI001D534542|nr:MULTISPECIES: PhzF family phenazine biosynthesis protein [unclassified Microcoleus]MCC3419969.1 PhzF family phenazine biosynthesis protein [Microcoleus sp. PH2017_07_MST_O_A]MCC3429020.1 PhzF family phenazine biosynthesis protein [Microcoleus sp. PH2017_04_SCI_O_A]MCC3440919.1 PhzF family phenazine biosynthesis protein [Microcoleus sp. PH2017_03_ELD_O_A]MCC3464561.1 PhzF family phenazine biosynthesis protein [Microcoleus sp. PH2017_06_SFM_O_A]MCC3503063.1 PhzF family phenazine biosynthesis 